MQMAKNTAEAFKSSILVTFRLDTMRMVIGAPLANTSSYGVMVSSEWGRHTSKKERDG